MIILLWILVVGLSVWLSAKWVEWIQRGSAVAAVLGGVVIALFLINLVLGLGLGVG